MISDPCAMLFVPPARVEIATNGSRLGGKPRRWNEQFQAWEYHQNLMYWTGISFRMHYRRAQRKRGTLAVAKQMRKQGFGIVMALAVLVRGR